MLKIAYSPIYKYELPAKHRFPMEKYELVPEQLLYEGTIEKSNFFHPERLTDSDILLTHTPLYLDKLNNNLLSKKEIRKIGFPVRPELIERGRYIAMGTYQSAHYAMEYGVSMNIAGGTHHSFADAGEGFCIFNDIAISINMLLNRGLINNALVIDLDVHQGNGTASIFEDRTEVFTFSVHGEKNYPLRKEKSDLDIGLPDGTTDAVYLDTIAKEIPKLIENFDPDIIFYLSGVDVLSTDKLGRLSLTKEGCKERDRMVLSLCQTYEKPVAVSMGGGYSERISDIIDAHSNTFRLAQDLYF